MTEVTRERLEQASGLLREYRDNRQNMLDSDYEYPETKPELRRQIALLDCALSHLSQPRTEGEPRALLERVRVELEAIYERCNGCDTHIILLLGDVKRWLSQSPQPPAGEIGTALGRWLLHDETCKAVDNDKGAFEYPCDCGLDSAIAALTRGQGWQPIETAPDRVRILVSYDYIQGNKTSGVEIKERCDGEFIWPSRYYVATGWQPLPPPHTDAGKGA